MRDHDNFAAAGVGCDLDFEIALRGVFLRGELNLSGVARLADLPSALFR